MHKDQLLCDHQQAVHDWYLKSNCRIKKLKKKEASSLKVGWLVAESLQATKSALERVYSYIIFLFP